MEVNMNSVSIGLGLSNVGSYSHKHLIVETTHIKFQGQLHLNHSLSQYNNYKNFFHILLSNCFCCKQVNYNIQKNANEIYRLTRTCNLPCSRLQHNLQNMFQTDLHG